MSAISPVCAETEQTESSILSDMIDLYPLIGEWRTWQQAQGLSALTIAARCGRVAYFAQHLGSDPADADPAQIVHYMAILAESTFRGRKMSRSSLATYHSHLKAWFAWLVKTDYRLDDPMSRVPAPKAPKRHPRPVSNRELEAILSVRVHRRTRMMILLAAFQGLRVHEIAKIRGEDVNLLDMQLRVVGKGGVDAVLPLHAVVAAEAEQYPRKGHWFTTHTQNSVHGHDGPILARSVSDIIGDVFDRAGVDGGAHRLRHWYGTTLLSGGANMRTVQTLLRHASLQTTQLYTDINVTDQKAAIQTLRIPEARDTADSAA